MERMARRQQNRENSGCPRNAQRSNTEEQTSNDSNGENSFNQEEFLQSVGQSVAAMLDPFGKSVYNMYTVFDDASLNSSLINECF